MANLTKSENGNGNGDAIDDSANMEPIDKRKIFVGGLSLDTDEEDLKNHFLQFGQVVHCVVKRDPVNDVSNHTVKGRRIDPKPAEPSMFKRTGEEGILKIFVGGLDSNMSDEDLRAYFEKFGAVKNLEWPKDRMRNNQKKNFAFVEFAEERVVNDVVRAAKQEIGGRTCDVRKAIPPAQKQQQNMNMDRNSGWGDFSSGGQGYGGGYGYDQYAAAYGYGTPEQFAAFYAQGYDPSAYFTDPATMAAYYGQFADYSGAAGYDYTTAAAGYAAAAAGYAGFGQDMSGGQDGYKSGGMRGGSMRGGSSRGGNSGNTSPRGSGNSGFGQKFGGMNGSGGGGGGSRGGTRGFHPYRR